MRPAARALLVLACVALPANAHAHPIGFGLLEIAFDGPEVAVHLATTTRGGAADVALSIPRDCRPIDRERVTADASSLDRRWRFDCESPPTRISLLDLPADLQVRAVVTRGSEEPRTALLDAGAPHLDLTAPLRGFAPFVALGVEHIATGWDHLLFVFVLLLLVRVEGDLRATARRLLATVTAFTLGHSVTLAVASTTPLSLPAPPTEACIALSILFLVRELDAGRSRDQKPPRKTLTQRWPALAALLFGLLHGFGFAGALREVLPASEVAWPLLGFNAGVELGQLAFVALAWAVVAACRRVRLAPRAARFVRVASFYVIGGVAAFWFVERTVALLPAG